MNGLLVVDKPPILTSFGVVNKVRGRLKRLSKIRKLKVGHAGTLDPFATGVLLICVGHSTRLAQYLTEAYKTYRATALFGVRTDTEDCDGEIIATHPTDHLTEGAIRAALETLPGHHQQTPPIYSAIHVDGQRAYDLARKGQHPDLPPRDIHIRDIEIHSIAPPTADFTLTASKGTYIRSICRDLGQDLGVGGHCTALRRTASSGFDITQAHTLATILDDWEAEDVHQHLIPPFQMLHHLPALHVTPEVALAFGYGQKPQPPHNLSPGDLARITPNGVDLTCIVEVQPDSTLKAVRTMPMQ